ncbi:MAG: type II secretion system protein GspE, partial [Chromatiaceae bacterium]
MPYDQQHDTLLDDLPALVGTRDDSGRDPDQVHRSDPEPGGRPVDGGVEDASSIPGQAPVETGPATVPERTSVAQIVAALYDRGKVTAGDLARARRLADDAGELLPRMLVRLGLVSERDMAQAMGEVLGLPLVDDSAFPSEPVAEGLFPLRFLKDARVLPL